MRTALENIRTSVLSQTAEAKNIIDHVWTICNRVLNPLEKGVRPNVKGIRYAANDYMLEHEVTPLRAASRVDEIRNSCAHNNLVVPCDAKCGSCNRIAGVAAASPGVLVQEMGCVPGAGNPNTVKQLEMLLDVAANVLDSPLLGKFCNEGESYHVDVDNMLTFSNAVKAIKLARGL